MVHVRPFRSATERILPDTVSTLNLNLRWPVAMSFVSKCRPFLEKIAFVVPINQSMDQRSNQVLNQSINQSWLEDTKSICENCLPVETVQFSGLWGLNVKLHFRIQHRHGRRDGKHLQGLHIRHIQHIIRAHGQRHRHLHPLRALLRRQTARTHRTSAIARAHHHLIGISGEHPDGPWLRRPLREIGDPSGRNGHREWPVQFATHVAALYAAPRHNFHHFPSATQFEQHVVVHDR